MSDTTRIAFVIPHYVSPRTGGVHGSQGEGRARRAAKLSATIARIHDVFPAKHLAVELRERLVGDVIERSRHDVTIVVVTNGVDHVVDDLRVDPASYVHVPVVEEPMMLGFAARTWLDATDGTFDWYGYVEDDLLIDDAAVLDKLAWFERLAPPESLLLPNRYEVTGRDARGKAYIDGSFVDHLTRSFQLPIDDERPAIVSGGYLERDLRFDRAVNPHSGFFLLSASQFEAWRATPHLRDRDTSFSSALESAATLGLLKTFAIYKPRTSDVGFFEVQHLGERFLAEVAPPVGGIAPDGPAPFRVDALQAEVDRLRHEVRRLEAERQRALDDIEEIHASTSWRVTAPLRSVVGRVRRRPTASSDEG